MSSKLLKSIVAGCVAAVAGGVQAAEWLGTGSDTLWGTAANWDSTTGVPVGNIAFTSTAVDNKTATLDGDYSFDGTFAISAGTAEAPFVFTATDEAVAVSNSLNQTSTKGFALTGALKVEKGIWNFANDIVPNGGYLHLTGGRLTTKYWMPVKGNSTIVVDDGELVMGYRDNGEQNNGRLNLAESADGVVTLTQNGGRIRCSNNTNKNNDTEALTIGSQARTTTTVNLNGGEMVVNGKTHIGYGATTKAELNVNGGTLTTTGDTLIGRNGEGVVNVKDGFVNSGTFIVAGYKSKGTLTQDGGQIQSTRSLQVGWGEGVEGEANFNGGTFTTPDWIELGYGKATKASMTVAGGTISLTGNNNTRLKVGVGISSYAELNVTSGSVNPGQAWTCIGEGASSTGIVNVVGGQYLSTNCDVSLGLGSASVAKLSIGKDGFFTCGSETVCKWLKMAEKANSTNEIVIAEGGVLAINHLQQVNEGSAKVVFDGGTVRQLQTDGNSCKYLFGSTTAYHPEICVTDKGGTIDVNGRYSRIKGVSIGGEGVLTLAGSGTMEFEKLPTCSLNLSGPALVDSDSESDFTQLTVSAGSYSYSSLPIASTGTIDLKGGQLALAADSAENKAQVVYHAGILLVDGSGYSDVTTGKQVTLTNVTLAEGVETIDVRVGGTAGFTWNPVWEEGVLKLVAADDTDPVNHWIGGAEGEWLSAANWTRGVPTVEQTVQVDNDAWIKCNWNGGKSIAKLVLNADRVAIGPVDQANYPGLTFGASGAIEGRGTLVLKRAGIFAESGLTITNDIIVLNNGTNDSWLQGGTARDKALIIKGRLMTEDVISKLCLYQQVYLQGDNSDYRAVVESVGANKKSAYGMYFCAPESGFSQASEVKVRGNLLIMFDAPGTLTLSKLTSTVSGNNCAVAAKGDYAVTLEVGAQDADCSFASGMKVCTHDWSGWWDRNSNLTIKKIGTGTLKTALKYVSTLQVAKGAISASEDLEVGTLTMAEGTSIALADEPKTITATGDVNMTGVKVTLSDALRTELAAKDAQTIDPSKYTVLAATGTVSGTPEESRLDVGTAAKPAWMWIARVKNNVLEYARRSAKKGFMVIIQ